jgi:CRP-like cAMP-binding protein
MGRALNLLEVALDGSFDYALCEVQVALAAMRDPEEVRRVASALVMMSARQMPPVRGRQVLVRRWLALVRAELARRVAGEGS